MIHYICLNENNEITNAGSIGGCVTEAYVLENIPGSVIVDKPIPNAFDVFWDGKQVLQKPSRPSFLHTFDLQTRSWFLSKEVAWADAKSKRNQLLLASDWTQLPDVPLGTKSVWSGYRQALRDITLQSDPEAIVWPTPPQN